MWCHCSNWCRTMPSKNPPSPMPKTRPAQMTRRQGEPDTSGGRRCLDLGLDDLLVVDEEPVSLAPDDGEDDEIAGLLTMGGDEGGDAAVFQRARIQDPAEANPLRLLGGHRRGSHAGDLILAQVTQEVVITVEGVGAQIVALIEAVDELLVEGRKLGDGGVIRRLALWHGER